MGDNNCKKTVDSEYAWIVVGTRKKKAKPPLRSEPPPVIPEPPPVRNLLPITNEESSEKIDEPCWFFNNGGCKHKDGTEKKSDECKYQHFLTENVKRPPHLCTRKPCDKFNIDGECKWNDNCKYSHRCLSSAEWSLFYPSVPYSLKTTTQKRIELETKLHELEGRMSVMEFKQYGISKDVERIGNILEKWVYNIQNLLKLT